MKLIIDIPEETKQAFDKAESNDIKGCYYDHGGVIGNAIKNGTPLQKGHGRLIDADETIKKICGESCGCYLEECGYEVPCFSVQRINSAPAIIEAESEDKE